LVGADSKKHETFGPGVSVGTEEGAEGCYLSFGLSQSVVNIGETEWLKRQQALMIYHHGHHPLLGAGILDHKYEWYLWQIHQGYNGQ
jgi:hypothetical protein